MPTVHTEEAPTAGPVFETTSLGVGPGRQFCGAGPNLADAPPSGVGEVVGVGRGG